MKKLVHFYGGIRCQIGISANPNDDARLSVDPLSSSSTLSKLFLSYREYLSPLELSKTAKAALQTAKRLSSSLTLLDFSEFQSAQTTDTCTSTPSMSPTPIVSTMAKKKGTAQTGGQGKGNKGGAAKVAETAKKKQASLAAIAAEEKTIQQDKSKKEAAERRKRDLEIRKKAVAD